MNIYNIKVIHILLYIINGKVIYIFERKNKLNVKNNK